MITRPPHVRCGVHKTLLGVVVVTVTLFGTACGDDDDGGDRLSTAEFETQANAICARGGADLDAAADELFDDLGPNELPDPEEVDEYMDDLLGPSVRDQLDEIRALEPPEDLEDEVDTFIDVTEATLDELAEMNGEQILELIKTGDDPFAEVNARANAIGLLECGDGVTEEE